METEQSANLNREEQTLSNIDNLSKMIQEIQATTYLARSEKELQIPPHIQAIKRYILGFLNVIYKVVLLISKLILNVLIIIAKLIIGLIGVVTCGVGELLLIPARFVVLMFRLGTFMAALMAISKGMSWNTSAELHWWQISILFLMCVLGSFFTTTFCNYIIALGEILKMWAFDIPLVRLW